MSKSKPEPPSWGNISPRHWSRARSDMNEEALDYLKRNDLDASKYETEFWFRVARTTAVLIMPVLALAFVFGSLRTGGAGGRLMIGVVIGLAYYLASETLANSGQVFNLNPVIVTWLPTAALAGITLFALSRIR